MDNQPYEVLESNFLRMQQRKAVVQAKIRNLISGKVLDRNFQPSDHLEEIELEKKIGGIHLSEPGRILVPRGKQSERTILAFGRSNGHRGKFFESEHPDNRDIF